MTFSDSKAQGSCCWTFDHSGNLSS